MFVKIHKSYRNVIAICDSELIGKKFEEGKTLLDVKEGFYKGEEMTPEEVEEIMIDMSMEDSTFNIIGKESIRIALGTRLISPEGVKTIQGIPYSLVLM